MKKAPVKVKIMVFGTFDVLHQGHLNFFEQARNLAKNPSLIVSVARDSNVKKIKGIKPSRNEKQRLLAVKKNRLADKAILGGDKKHLPHILKTKPQIIALGYDQKAYTQNLKSDLANAGLEVKVIRLKPHHPKKFKSSLIKQKML